MHGPEFYQLEIPVVPAYPLLQVKDPTTGIDHNCNPDDQKERKKNDQSKNGKQKIEKADHLRVFIRRFDK
jgi:hypothetical protein